MYKRKTHDEWQLLSNYGNGWEVELVEFTREDALQTLKEYKDNCPNAQYKLKKARIKNVSRNY